MKTIEVNVRMIATTYKELSDKDMDQIRLDIESDLCNTFAEFESIDVKVSDY